METKEKRKAIDPSFGKQLVVYLSQASLKMAEFSRLVGVNPSHTLRIVRGERPPPLEGLDRWAEILCLTPEQTENFIELAHLTHCPEMIRVKFLKMKAHLVKGSALRIPNFPSESQ